MSQHKVKKEFWLIIFLLLALTVALTNAFLSNRLQNTIKGNILNLFANISYSYIVSYIFYLVALLPARRDKKLLLTFIVSEATNILTELDKMFSNLFSEFGIDNNKANIKKLCSQIILSNQIQKFSWMHNYSNGYQLYKPTFGEYIYKVINDISILVGKNENLFLSGDNAIYGITKNIANSQFFQIYHNTLCQNGVVVKNQSLQSFYTMIEDIYEKKEQLRKRISIIKKDQQIQ